MDLTKDVLINVLGISRRNGYVLRQDRTPFRYPTQGFSSVPDKTPLEGGLSDLLVGFTTLPTVFSLFVFSKMNKF